MPPVITWRVVSSPPTRISSDSCSSASSSSRSPSTSAWTRMLIRSSAGRARAPVGDHVGAVGRVLERRLRGGRHRLGRRREREAADQVVGPAQQAVAVLGQHAEHVADHDHRQRRGDLAHEVDAALLRGASSISAGADRADPRLVLGDAARREAAVHQVAAPLVIVAVEVDHRRDGRRVGPHAEAVAEGLGVLRARHAGRRAA